LAVFSPDQEKPRFIVDDESLRSAMAVAVAPDGKHVVTGHSGGEARTWSALEDSEPQRVIRVETKTALFPLFHDGGKSLILATQPARGVHWTYDRSKPSGFDFKGGTSPPTCELRFLAIPSGEAQDIWRFVDGSFRTIYARFGSSKRYPEYNPSRFAVSRDGKTLVAGCNGCCTIDVKTGKLTHAFDRIRPQDSQD
jgi:hypothetical protein